MHERSLRGTVSDERGMAMKSVVRDCLSGARSDGESADCGFRGVGMGIWSGPARVWMVLVVETSERMESAALSRVVVMWGLRNLR